MVVGYLFIECGSRSALRRLARRPDTSEADIVGENLVLQIRFGLEVIVELYVFSNGSIYLAR